MNKYKLAIFDLDGVLTETSEQHYLAWKELTDNLELRFDRSMNEQLKGIPRMASFEIILRENKKEAQYTEEEKLRFITQKNEIYKKLICDFTPDNLFEGVLELFESLKSRGVKIALASASHNGPALLRSMGISDLFDIVVDPGTIEHGKPAPDIFLEAAKRLGIEPTECIGFEDAVAGITAIKSAGMFAVGIGEPDILKEADLVLPSIKMFEM